MRRLVALTLLACLLSTACVGALTPEQNTFEDLSACLSPAAPGSAGEGSLSVLVDRAEIIASVTVVKAEHTYRGYRDQVGARRLTLRTLETLKGATPGAEFVIDDGPCPMLVGREGESFVAFFTNWNYYGPGLKPIGLPVSALRPTATRTLAQVVSAVRAVRPLDGDARDLFAKYGWRVTGVEGSNEFDLPPLGEFAVSREIFGAAPAIMGSLDRYAIASDDIGLDMRVAAGKHVELLSFWLDRQPFDYTPGAPGGHVLIFDRRIIAAWVRIMPWNGPFSVRDRAGALAANPDAQPSYPPANRFPDGINVTTAYGLATATGLSFKSGTGGNGDITDVSRLRAFASALDNKLPTTQAVWDRNGSPTAYYLHFTVGSSAVSFEYDTASGTLTSVYDGFAVRPGPPFAALIATLK